MQIYTRIEIFIAIGLWGLICKFPKMPFVIFCHLETCYLLCPLLLSLSITVYTRVSFIALLAVKGLLKRYFIDYTKAFSRILHGE